MSTFEAFQAKDNSQKLDELWVTLGNMERMLGKTARDVGQLIQVVGGFNETVIKSQFKTPVVETPAPVAPIPPKEPEPVKPEEPTEPSVYEQGKWYDYEVCWRHMRGA